MTAIFSVKMVLRHSNLASAPILVLAFPIYRMLCFASLNFLFILWDN